MMCRSRLGITTIVLLLLALVRERAIEFCEGYNQPHSLISIMDGNISFTDHVSKCNRSPLQWHK